MILSKSISDPVADTDTRPSLPESVSECRETARWVSLASFCSILVGVLVLIGALIFPSEILEPWMGVSALGSGGSGLLIALLLRSAADLIEGVWRR